MLLYKIGLHWPHWSPCFKHLPCAAQSDMRTGLLHCKGLDHICERLKQGHHPAQRSTW